MMGAECIPGNPLTTVQAMFMYEYGPHDVIEPVDIPLMTQSKLDMILASQLIAPRKT